MAKRAVSSGGRHGTRVPAPVPGPANPAVSVDAVVLFERGLAAVERHAYAEGGEVFRDILERFPFERALGDRARVYLALCERNRARAVPSPKTIEERLTLATAALNDEDDERAAGLAREVLKEVPRHDLATYLLAVVETRRGSVEGALELLRSAIHSNPELQAQIRHDADFERLRPLAAFQALLVKSENGRSAAPVPPRPRKSRLDR